MLSREISWVGEIQTRAFPLKYDYLASSTFQRIKGEDKKMAFCPIMAHNAETNQQPPELCHQYPFCLQMLRCYFEVWITPWLHKAHVPVALCRWLTSLHESLTYRGSITTTSISLPGLLRPKLKWETAVQNHHRAFLAKHMLIFLPEKDAQNLCEKDKTCLDWILLSSCTSVFLKLNCRCVCCHSFSGAPSILWLKFPSSVKTLRKLCWTFFILWWIFTQLWC